MNRGNFETFGYEIFHSTANVDLLLEGISSVAQSSGMTLVEAASSRLHFVDDSGCVVAEVAWRPSPHRWGATMSHPANENGSWELHFTAKLGCSVKLAKALTERLSAAMQPFNHSELLGLTRTMPLVTQFSHFDDVLAGWALIFRDHYLEHSVGFLFGMHRAGIPARWIYALAKGDRTRNRDRIHATFLAEGFQSDLLDNAILGPTACREAAMPLLGKLDEFIDAAHQNGRRIMVVDDGGLIALGYGSRCAKVRVDAAIELTVSGLKRIRSVPDIDIPVVNMARSMVKVLLGYPEIADSCVRRIRELLPSQKLIGRPALLVGYGLLGSRIAIALRSLGVRVSVVDTDVRALISAAEHGFPTFRSLRDALVADPPMLIVSAAGESVLDAAVLDQLPDGVFLAPFATRDFSVCQEDANLIAQSTAFMGIGRRFQLRNGNSFVLLGEGRSLNLFETDSIPNQGYDAYRAGTLIAARQLARVVDGLRPGIHNDFADEAVSAAGLFERYYELHLSICRGMGDGKAPETETE